MSPIRTPDGRYIVVRGRLWRASNPDLGDAERQALVNDLMDARRRVGSTSGALRAEARADVDRAKRALGERGPVWWTDGAPDLNRHLVRNTLYADWFAGLSANAL
ncbi:hypothetical protein SAMN02983003_3087 [Devosia enhydra]|uniref:Uncharacterized protein n=1 Tax=Devosia enhydra TaxID=665118 RepID=A0A1K2I135_9HYPH|nr:hypothetical protein [Devosia enhydra]SFZ85915.1 hypothetical protein SAMN02983003_3087 [Devosia enhydra]